MSDPKLTYYVSLLQDAQALTTLLHYLCIQVIVELLKNHKHQELFEKTNLRIISPSALWTREYLLSFVFLNIAFEA